VDREQIVRIAARGALKHGVLPALGKRGVAPFAKRLVLHVGAALTHVDPVTRRDAPAALETLLDAAPELVAAHAPAATLRHLADLLRRGDDAASSALDASASATAAAAAASARRRAARYGLSPTFGDMTASRVGAATPAARFRLLTACRRFLETLVSLTIDHEHDDHGRDRDRARSRPFRSRTRSIAPFAVRDEALFDEALAEKNDRYDVGAATRATHAFRLARPPLDAATAVLDAFGDGRTSRAAAAERDDGGAGVPAAAADLAALLFAAWDEATPALCFKNAGGGGADGGTHVDLLVKTKAMTEALVCVRLALRLVDRADARGPPGGVPGAAAGAAAGALAARVLGGGAFPAVAPAAHGAPERRALVAYNAAAAALLSAAADGVGAVLDARRAERAVAAERDDEGCAEDDGSGEDGSGEDDAEADASSESDAASDSDDAYDGTPYASSDASSDAIDARAADVASASVASYLAGALRGVALDAGPCGEAERTAEGDYGELLRAARRALARAPSVSRARSSAARRARGARAELVDAVGEVWTRAVVEGPPERRAACVSLLAAALPSAYALRDEKNGDDGDVSHPARSGLAESAAARWLRPSARALWELKHRDPATTTRLLAALRAVASRATAARAPATHEALVAVESELAPFFALAPPPSADPDAPRVPAKLGPFARLPPAARAEAIALLGCLPALSPATVRAVAHAALAPAANQTEAKKRKRGGVVSLDGDADDVATRAVDAVAANVAAAPLALSTSFFAAVLTGAPEWERAERVASAAARALVDLGDADAWAGAALAWGAVAAARRRARASDTRRAEGRAVYGALRLAAAAAEASAGAGDGPETLAPPDLEEDVPRLLASALTLARARGERSATPNREPNRDEDDEDDEDSARSALDGVALRALRAAPRWAAGTFSALAGGAAADDDEAVDAVRAAALAASRAADFLSAERLARTRPEAERGDAWKTEHYARDTETNETMNAKAKASAEACVSGLRAAADALVRAGVAGAARAASAARDAARDVQDAFP